MPVSIKLRTDDMVVEIHENGLGISVLAPQPDDPRPCWQGIPLTSDQTDLLMKFMNINVEMK